MGDLVPISPRRYGFVWVLYGHTHHKVRDGSIAISHLHWSIFSQQDSILLLCERLLVVVSSNNEQRPVSKGSKSYLKKHRRDISGVVNEWRWRWRWGLMEMGMGVESGEPWTLTLESGVHGHGPDWPKSWMFMVIWTDNNWLKLTQWWFNCRATGHRAKRLSAGLGMGIAIRDCTACSMGAAWRPPHYPLPMNHHSLFWRDHPI